MSTPQLFLSVEGQGVVTADNLNILVQTPQTASQLREFTGTPGMAVMLQGIQVPNDGSGGFFYWNAAGTEPDDNYNYIQPPGSIGQWVRLFAAPTTGFVASVANISALENIPYEIVPNNTVVYVENYATTDDQGGGIFEWDVTSTAIVDGGYIVKANSNPGTGRWIRQSSFITPQMYGAVGNGVTDDTAALQAAVVAAETLGLPFEGASYLQCAVSSTITFAAGTYYGNQMTIKPLPSMTSGYILAFNQTGSITNVTPVLQLDGFIVSQALTSGHVNEALNVDGINCENLAQAYISNLSVQGFRRGVVFSGPNFYICKFQKLNVSNGWQYGVANFAATDSNEKIVISDSLISNINNTSFNGIGLYIDPTASFNGLVFHASSIDYCDQSIINNVGIIDLISPHFENNNNNPHIQLISNSGKYPPGVRFFGGEMGGGALQSWNNPPPESVHGRPAYITTANGGGSVFIYGTQLGAFYQTDFVTQVVENPSGSPNQNVYIQPFISSNNGNAAAPPIFDYETNSVYISTTNLNGWSQNSGTGVTISFSSASFYSPDVGSRQIVGTAAATASIVQTLSVSPGELVVFKAYVNLSAISAGYAALRAQFLAQDGTTVVSDIFSPTLTSVTSGYVPLWIVLMAPAGAVSVRVEDYVFDFTGTVNFSNEVCWIS